MLTEIIHLFTSRHLPTTSATYLPISTTKSTVNTNFISLEKSVQEPFITPSSSTGTQLIVRRPDSLVIEPIMFNSKMYHVLRLSPLSTFESPPMQTAYDLILPDASAFDSHTYPIFTASKCT